MRIKAKVVGIGARKSGTSKKGRAYDFTPFHLVYEDKNTEGFAVATTNVDQSILDALPMPQLNQDLDMFCHFYNGNMTVDGIL